MNTFNLKKIVVGLGMGLAFAVPAMAQPIASFDYSQELEFTDPIGGDVVGSGGSPNPGLPGNIDGFTKLEWGFEGDDPTPSSLVINATGGDSTVPDNQLIVGNVTTAESYGNEVGPADDVIFAAGPSLTHNNFVISNFRDALDAATLQDYVILSPNPADGNPAQEQSLSFNFNFKETRNAQAGADCPAFGNGVVFADDKCGDILAIGNELFNTPIVVNEDELAFLIDSFVRGGYIYQVLLRESTDALRVLTDAACEDAEAPDGCIGFVTAEEQSTTFGLEFAIVAFERIPAPATLALFGASLLSMVWIRRRKASA